MILPLLSFRKTRLEDVEEPAVTDMNMLVKDDPGESVFSLALAKLLLVGL